MRRSKFCVWLIAGLSLAACDVTAQAAPFAVACTGNARFSDTSQGKLSERQYTLPTQIYVIDEAEKRIQRALTPRQQFEDVCFRGGYIDGRNFSPGLISVRSEKKGEMCDFELSRATGKGEFLSYFDLPGGGHSEIKFEMNCDRTKVPVFDNSKNKF